MEVIILILQLHTPPYPLNQFVASYIYYRGYTGSKRYEQLLPDSHARLIIELDGNERLLLDDNYQIKHTFKNAWVSGIQSRPVTYMAEQNATTLCIQFRVGGLYTLLGIPAIKFQDKMYDATLLHSSLKPLREQLLAETSIDHIFQLTTTFLYKRIFAKNEQTKLVTLLQSQLFEHSIKDISQKVGYSQKHLIHIFKQEVGTTPKKYQRLMRFNKALHYLQTETKISTLDLVSLCQFYDQAHLIHEFCHFTSYTPRQYLQLTRDYPHVIPING